MALPVKEYPARDSTWCPRVKRSFQSGQREYKPFSILHERCNGVACYILLSPWPQIVSSHACAAQYSAKYRETFWGSPVLSLCTVLSSGTVPHQFHLPWHLEPPSLVSLLRKSVKQHVGNPHIHTTLLPGSSQDSKLEQLRCLPHSFLFYQRSLSCTPTGNV